MVFNLITLSIAFYDGSKQVEGYQSKKFDRFLSDAIYLEAKNLTVSIVSKTPFTDEIAQLALINERNCPKSKSEEECIADGQTFYVPTVECSDEFKKENAEFWNMRMPKDFGGELIEGLVCFDHSDMFLQSEKLSETFAHVKMEYDHCIDYNTTAE